MHSTDNLSDGYLGSGKRISASIKKHGKENHELSILEFCSSREELSKREKEIVTKELLEMEGCLNLCVGGEGGDKLSFHPHGDKIYRKIDRSFFDDLEYRIKMSESIKEWITKNPEAFAERQKAIGLKRKGYKHSAEAKAKISDAAKNMSDETRKKISDSLSGRKRTDIAEKAKERFSDKLNHPRTKVFILVDSFNNEYEIVGFENLGKFCKEYGISFNTLVMFKNSKVPTDFKCLNKKHKSTIGWGLYEKESLRLHWPVSALA